MMRINLQAGIQKAVEFTNVKVYGEVLSVDWLFLTTVDRSMSTSCHGLITAYVDCLRQTECYKVCWKALCPCMCVSTCQDRCCCMCCCS